MSKSTSLLRFFLLGAIALHCTACSIFMAASGGADPDLNVLQKGTARASVEKELGRPVSSIRRSWGDEVTYQYVTDAEPSYLRATAYTALGLATGFVSELFTTPMESLNALQGEQQTVVVTYDIHGFLKSVDHATAESAVPKLGTLISGENTAAVEAGRAPEPVMLERGRYSGEG